MVGPEMLLRRFRRSSSEHERTSQAPTADRYLSGERASHPLHVIVRAHQGRVLGPARDPITGHPDLPAIAEEATSLLDAALEKVAADG